MTQFNRTPAHVVMDAIRRALAIHHESDRPMDHYQRMSHARRIVLAALGGMDAEYADAIPGLIGFEESTDHADCACALMDAASEIQSVADDYEQYAEMDEEMTERRFRAQHAAYHLRQHVGLA